MVQGAGVGGGMRLHPACRLWERFTLVGLVYIYVPFSNKEQAKVSKIKVKQYRLVLEYKIQKKKKKDKSPAKPSFSLSRTFVMFASVAMLAITMPHPGTRNTIKCFF